MMNKEIVEILKGLANETRLKIVCLLIENELCVCELMEVLGMNQSCISNHIKILRSLGIIEAKREGKWIFYSIPKNKMDKSTYEIIQSIMKKLEKEKKLRREKTLINRLIQKRGKG